jgi:Leucine-rich repeat (LRR) protein
MNFSSISNAGNLISLERLCINDTAISTLPMSIKYLKKLKGLDLSSNRKLRHIPDYIQYLSGLEEIYLSRTKIVSLPGTIGKLANLSYIDLNYTGRLKRLPEELNSLTKLEEISLQCSGITSLSNIEGLQSLEILDLSGNTKLETLPAGIFAGLNISTINLSSCSISSLPKSIGSLQSLEKLDINGNTNLETLPDGIFAGLNIRTLDLSSCSISSLPKSIGSLRNLEELNISFLNLESLEISGWKKLRELKASHTSLESIRIVNVDTLEAIDICGSKKLAVLSLTGLSSLKYLHFGQITSIPDSLFDLKKLEHLNISILGNLTDISRDIERILLGCSSLKFLIVHSNNIVKINPNDAAYRNLEVFDLYRNPILSDGNKSGNEMLLNLIQNCPYLGCIGDLTDDSVEVKPEFAQHVYLLTKNRIRKRLSSLGSQHGALWPYILSRNVKGYGCGKVALLPSCDHCCCGCGCYVGISCGGWVDCCATASLSHADCIFRLLVDHGGHNIISQHSS